MAKIMVLYFLLAPFLRRNPILVPKEPKEGDHISFLRMPVLYLLFSAGANWRWRIFPQRLWLYVYFYIQWTSLILLLCQTNLPHYKSVKEVIYSVHEWDSELQWSCLCGLECSLQRINAFSWQVPHVFFACKAKEWGR